MHISQMTLVFFLYGLSFFTMGIIILQEVGRCSDVRLRRALRFLAIFGLLHGFHEWMEMFLAIGAIPSLDVQPSSWLHLRLIILALSFLALATFGVLLPFVNSAYRRLALLIPLSLLAIWAFGILVFQGIYQPDTGYWEVVDVWTRYVLAIPAALLACWGLIYQQREFRRRGMASFGRDSLWAAIAFAWYGLIGQVFVNPSPLPPSNVINTGTFLNTFGFPVQIMRAVAALVAAIFVARFLRSFQVETQKEIQDLQGARLEEAQRREALRGELLRRVVAAQEAERQRIARELHDETGQALTAIGLGVRSVATNIHQDSEKAAANIRQIQRMVDRSLDDLQRIIGDLRPSHLDDLGLAAALRWYANEVQKRASLEITFELSGESPETPSEVKTAIFRIAQEALTNVIRHSGAQSATVRLMFDAETVTLEVQDNGHGFDTKKIGSASRPAWGLLGMEERANLLGGSLKIDSEPGKGTTVNVIIPYIMKE
jgi:signal transduction histidine kinase